MTVEQRRQEIVGLLRKDGRSIKLAERIDRCRQGLCERCGDVCPVKANRWADESITKLVNLLDRSGSEPLLKLRYTKESWSRRSGELALPGLSLYEKQERRADHQLVFPSTGGVVKALRRALDKLNDPRVVAIGMTDAWFGYKDWKIGGSLIMVGVIKSALYDAFPGGDILIEPVSDTRESLLALFARSRRPKLLPPLDAVQKMPRPRQREYLAWLADMTANERLFRYGCDRYFNRLAKIRRPGRVIEKKGHPNPHWLEGYKFNNHLNSCQCRACGGLGKYYRRVGT
jgi:hypothetical protein